MKGGTVMILIWTSLLILIIILFIRLIIRERHKRRHSDDPTQLRKRFKGIVARPDFCQAIYQSFKNQQANSAAILTAGEEQPTGRMSPQTCDTCLQIAEEARCLTQTTLVRSVGRTLH